MPLPPLLSSLELHHYQLATRPEPISGLTADSRQVGPGMLFAALAGTQHDGRLHIAEAIKRGASVILTDSSTPPPADLPASISWLQASNPRHVLSQLAARFYGPSPAHLVAVTGTAGKSSVVHYVRQIWQQLGANSASIGTLGVITAAASHYGGLTTPDAITLHQQLKSLKQQAIDYVALEASSHGLDLHRLDHVLLEAAAFTNFSRDHLDYHQTMESYFLAKSRLFSAVLPIGGTAVLNADIPEFASLKAICEQRQQKIIDFGENAKTLKLQSLVAHAHQLQFDLATPVGNFPVTTPLTGAFQAWNVLTAIGLVQSSGAWPLADILATTPNLTAVPGRLEQVGNHPQGAKIFVDYAHKPEALAKVLATLRALLRPGAALWVVFGCGGNRDAGKRPQMGKIAVQRATHTIITDDNPRREDAASIRQQVLAGCNPRPPSHTLQEIGDRQAAIAYAIKHLQPHDLLVIAGKGHETGQIIGDQTLPFDDVAVAAAALADLGGATS